MKIALLVLLLALFVFVDVTVTRSIKQSDLQELDLMLHTRLARSSFFRKSKRKKVKRIKVSCAAYCRMDIHTHTYAGKCGKKTRKRICHVCRVLLDCGKKGSDAF